MRSGQINRVSGEWTDGSTVGGPMERNPTFKEVATAGLPTLILNVTKLKKIYAGARYQRDTAKRVCASDRSAGPLSPILWHPEFGAGWELKPLRQYSNDSALPLVDI
jgi:hypothetical protein